MLAAALIDRRIDVLMAVSEQHPGGQAGNDPIPILMPTLWETKDHR